MMLTSKLRPVTRRVGILSSADAASSRVARNILPIPSTLAHNIATTTSASSTSRRFITTEQEKHFQGRGILDAQGMTAFNTLHELQVHSSLVFSENELFGTYEEESKSYIYMTYDDYNQKVNQCRALLKDLGE